MAKVKFSRGTTPTGSVEFSRNPSVTNGDDTETVGYLQPKDRADGGDWYISDKGVSPENYKSLLFSNNPESDWDNLKTFLAAMVGALYNFTFTDSDGGTHTARIWNAENLQCKRIATGRVSFLIELLIES